ncbi:MAG: biotin--[acetyl-CoA-carboxylase] ligase [Candidatus Gastranaerophilaceae bacterium]
MELLFLQEVDSTNKYAKEHLSQLPDMTVIYTDLQTAGRGRLERKWNYTGGENIYASIILKPDSEMKEVYSNLTQYLCVILAKVFEEYGVKPNIKWPNDIQVNSKKISGILAEGVIKNGKIEGLVLGFGVNLNCKKEELDKINQPATALNIEIGQNINRDNFLKKIMEKFCLSYNKFIEEGFLFVREEYIKRAGFLNKEIKVKAFDKEFCGIAKDILENGALLLEDKENKEHIFLIGDIL